MKTPSFDNPSGHYPLGKLPQSELIELLSRFNQSSDPRVILGPGLGRDAAVIDIGETYLVAKSDPITFTSEQIGWYAVNVNANDIACLGAQPKWFLATLLLPEGKTTHKLVTHIFQQLYDASNELGITIVGGHTEITNNLDRPIISGTMFGEVDSCRLIRSDGTRPGDKIIMTKKVCVEGTALIAREFYEELKSQIEPLILERAANFLFDPGISVIQDAAIMQNAGEVHAMHDPTEGGIATGLYEMIAAARCGASIMANRIPFYPETKLLCERFDLDPLGLIASGSLLAAVAPQDAESILQALMDENVEATIIGTVDDGGAIKYITKNKVMNLPHFTRDEFTRIFES